MISSKINGLQVQLNELSSLLSMFERSQCVVCSKKMQVIQRLSQQLNQIKTQRAKLKKQIFQLKLIIEHQNQNISSGNVKAFDKHEAQLKRYKQFQNYQAQTDYYLILPNNEVYTKKMQIHLQNQKLKHLTYQSPKSLQIQNILNISPQSKASKSSENKRQTFRQNQKQSTSQNKKLRNLQSRSQKSQKLNIYANNNQQFQFGNLREFDFQYLEQQQNLKLTSFLIENNAKLSLLVERVNYLIKLRQISRVDESQQWKSIQQVKEILKNQIKKSESTN